MLTAFNCLKNAGISAATWVLVGVPVAAIVCATQMYIWVVFIVPRMAALAAMMGLLHGLWLQIIGRRAISSNMYLLLLGGISGVVLGLLAFLPMYADAEIVVEEVTVQVFTILVLSGILGGAAAGIATTYFVRLPARLTVRFVVRAVTASCVFLAPLLSVDYAVFWKGVVERLPILAVSEKEISVPFRGDARGSLWSGCYAISGRNASGTGGERGYIFIGQNNGDLEMIELASNKSIGGVDRNGRFQLRSKVTLVSEITREMWEGRFHDSYFDFVRRSTRLAEAKFVHNERLTGIGRRVPCPPGFFASKR